jgi:hypothetical protein
MTGEPGRAPGLTYSAGGRLRSGGGLPGSGSPGNGGGTAPASGAPSAFFSTIRADRSLSTESTVHLATLKTQLPRALLLPELLLQLVLRFGPRLLVLLLVLRALVGRRGARAFGRSAETPTMMWKLSPSGWLPTVTS